MRISKAIRLARGSPAMAANVSASDEHVRKFVRASVRTRAVQCAASVASCVVFSI